MLVELHLDGLKLSPAHLVLIVRLATLVVNHKGALNLVLSFKVGSQCESTVCTDFRIYGVEMNCTSIGYPGEGPRSGLAVVPYLYPYPYLQPLKDVNP